MAGHTPGPWDNENKAGDLAEFMYITNMDGRRVCKIAGYGKKPRYRSRQTDDILNEEDEANAQLIAAAPELLEVLQMIKRVTPITHLTGRCYSAMEKAIAKATGESR